MNGSDAQESGESAGPFSSRRTNGTAEDNANGKRVTLRERLSHLTWAWFTFPQSQGGIAIVLAETPHRFNGLTDIGKIVFIFNIVVFVTLTCAMAARFLMFPEKFKKSFTHPPECFFFGSFWLSLATIIACIQLYGVPDSGPWLVVAVRVLFWIYAAVVLCTSIVLYIVFAVKTPIKDITSTPALWLFAVLCSMLTGTVASVIAPDQPPVHRLPIIVAGLSYQGLGLLVCLFVITLFFNHMLREGLPPPDQRPGMFMPVGSTAFSIVAFIGLAKSVPIDYGYFASHPMAKEILLVLALFVSIFIWVFTFWLFGLAVLGNLLCIRHMGFKLAWWAIIFPNVGFTLATIDIGTELESPAILWVGTAMTILLVAFWLLDLFLTFKAIFTKRVLWPGQDEDKDS